MSGTNLNPVSQTPLLPSTSCCTLLLVVPSVLRGAFLRSVWLYEGEHLGEVTSLLNLFLVACGKDIEDKNSWSITVGFGWADALLRVGTTAGSALRTGSEVETDGEEGVGWGAVFIFVLSRGKKHVPL